MKNEEIESFPRITTNTVRRRNYQTRRHNCPPAADTFLICECDHPRMIPLPRRRAICNSTEARSPGGCFAASRLENPKWIIGRFRTLSSWWWCSWSLCWWWSGEDLRRGRRRCCCCCCNSCCGRDLRISHFWVEILIWRMILCFFVNMTSVGVKDFRAIFMRESIKQLIEQVNDVVFELDSIVFWRMA